MVPSRRYYSPERLQHLIQLLNDDGMTTRTASKILTIQIPPGTKTGTKITFANEGDQAPNVVPGMRKNNVADVTFVVKEDVHPTFKRDGNNLVHESQVSLLNALTGSVIELKTLDERLLKIGVNDTIMYPHYNSVPTTPK